MVELVCYYNNDLIDLAIMITIFISHVFTLKKNFPLPPEQTLVTRMDRGCSLEFQIGEIIHNSSGDAVISPRTQAFHNP